MQSSQHKEPLIRTEIPPSPWHTIGTDLFYLDGAEYLLVADYYSKYLIVREVPKGKSSSRTMANLTKDISSEQGIPKIVRSDNGPHFEGQAYKEFSGTVAGGGGRGACPPPIVQPPRKIVNVVGNCQSCRRGGGGGEDLKCCRAENLVCRKYFSFCPKSTTLAPPPQKKT